MKRLLLVGASITSLSVTSVAQTTSDVYWNFNTAAATSTTPANPALSVSSVTQGNNNGTTTLIQTNSSSSGYTFPLNGTSTAASGGNNAGAAALTGAFSSSTSTYFEVTFTPAAGQYLGISNVNFSSRSTTTGPQGYSISTSVGGYGSPVGTGTLSNNSVYSYYTNTVSVSGGLAAPITLRIYGHSGTGNASANTANWRVDDLVVTVITSSVPLSLEDLDFRASAQGGAVNLTWRRSLAPSHSSLTIERGSDGQNFSPVYSASTHVQEGAFTDERPANGPNYYRLRLTDRSGQSWYSGVRTIQMDESGTTVFAPNPASHSVTIVAAPIGSTATLIDLAGRPVKTAVVGKNGTAHLRISDLPTGVYILQTGLSPHIVRHRLQIAR